MDYSDEIEPLNTEETKWIKKLEKLLLACPSDRLGLITIGDSSMSVFDDAFARNHDLDLEDGKADRQGLVLGFVRSKPTIHGVSG